MHFANEPDFPYSKPLFQHQEIEPGCFRPSGQSTPHQSANEMCFDQLADGDLGKTRSKRKNPFPLSEYFGQNSPKRDSPKKQTLAIGDYRLFYC